MNSQSDAVNTNTDKPAQNKPQPKKAYRQPQLSVYGDLHELTQAVGAMGMSDGGTMLTMMMTSMFF